MIKKITKNEKKVKKNIDSLYNIKSNLLPDKLLDLNYTVGMKELR